MYSFYWSVFHQTFMSVSQSPYTGMEIYISSVIFLLYFEILCIFSSIMQYIKFSKVCAYSWKLLSQIQLKLPKLLFIFFCPFGIPLCPLNRCTWFSAECNLSQSWNTLQVSNSVSLFLVCPHLNLRMLKAHKAEEGEKQMHCKNRWALPSLLCDLNEWWTMGGCKGTWDWDEVSELQWPEQVESVCHGAKWGHGWGLLLEKCKSFQTCVLTGALQCLKFMRLKETTLVQYLPCLY